MPNLNIESWVYHFRDIFDFLKAPIFAEISNGTGFAKDSKDITGYVLRCLESKFQKKN